MATSQITAMALGKEEMHIKPLSKYGTVKILSQNHLAIWFDYI